MRFEAQGKLDEAQEVYDTILQEDDTNMVSCLIDDNVKIVTNIIQLSWLRSVKLHY